METYKKNDEISFDLPDGFMILSDETDNDSEKYLICKDEYENDEGETDYRVKFNMSMMTYNSAPADGKTALEALAETFLENGISAGTIIKYVSIPGKPYLIFTTSEKTLNLFGLELKYYILSLSILVNEDSGFCINSAQQINLENLSDINSLYENILIIANSILVNGKKLSLETISAQYLADHLKPVFENSQDMKAELEFNLTDSDNEMENEFGITHPDQALYPHYASIKNSEFGFSNINVVINNTGTEYEFQPIEGIPYQWNSVTYEKAQEMTRLFHVNIDVFDAQHDREAELHNSYMRKAYMMSALRSFAWTLADYCKKNNTTPKEVNLSVLSRLVDFIAKKEWLNYDGDKYCQGLCSGSDLHVYFLPDSFPEEDKKKFLPSQEDYNRVKEVKETFNNYNEILCEVHSLDALRSDLEYIYPAVHTLYEKLLKIRDISHPLEGNESDIVYAWCALTLAAKQPFFSEDGPVNYYLLQTLDQEEEKKSEERRRYIAKEQWLQKYGEYIERNPEIEFQGKLFAFTGFPLQEEDELVQKITERGGQKRTLVSGRTHYLVVEPSNAGLAMVNDGIEQMKKRSNIKMILAEDLERILADDPTAEKQTFSSIVSEKQPKSKNVSAKVAKIQPIPSDFPKGKYLSLSDLDMTGNCLDDCPINEEHIILPTGIKKIGNMSFVYCSKMKSVVIPDGVTHIGKGAFSDCKNLQSISLPNSLTEFENSAFSGCENLQSVVIPEGVTHIGEGVFSGCKNLQSISLPNSLTEIKEWEFSKCESLQSVVIPDGITYIGKGAFSDCKNLQSISLPNSLTEIENSAFSGCENLQSVVIPEGVTHIGEHAFSNCKRLQSISLPISLSEIGQFAFWGCNNLKSVAVSKDEISTNKKIFSNGKDFSTVAQPITVTGIGQSAFNGCENLQSVAIPEGITHIGEGVFSGCKNLQSISLPNSLSEINESAFYGCESLQSIIIPEGVTHIGEYAFSDCKNIESISLPNTVEQIGFSAFSGNRKLKSISLPSMLREVEVCTFQGCESLIVIFIPNGVTTVGESAFEGCAGLMDIFVPGSVVEIEENAFNTGNLERIVHVSPGSYAEEYCKKYNITCDNLMPDDYTRRAPRPVTETSEESEFEIDGEVLKKYKGKSKSVFVPESVKTIDKNAFIYNTHMEEVILPQNLVEIGEAAFSGCKKLTSVHIPEGTVCLAKWAFSDCEELQSISLPNSLSKIHNSAFIGCKNLQSVVIPKNVTYIGESAFSGCEKLISVSLPNSLSEIKESVFNGCENLQSILIPEGVTNIGEYAFLNCKGLQSISLPNSLSEIGEEVFGSCQNLKSIVIPEGVTVIGMSAFSFCETLTDVYLPDTVSEIGDHSFLCSDAVTLHVPTGCYAESYAIENHIPYDNHVEGIWNHVDMKSDSKNLFTNIPDNLSYEHKEDMPEEKDQKKSEAESTVTRRKAEYEALLAQIADQARIAEENKGGFLGLGKKAQIRKEALQKIAELQEKLKGYPEFQKK